MAYHIAQEQEYLDNNLWRWSVSIDASDGELERVQQVTWYLHHTFNPSVVVVDDRDSHFALKRHGWGVFQIRADVETAGERVALREWLQLDYPGGEVAPERGAAVKGSRREARRVFLSYGAEDDRIADGVKVALQQHGYDVKDDRDIASGQPFDAAVSRMIRESDMVLGFVSSEFTSPFVIDEMTSAARSDKPTIAFMANDVMEPQGLEVIQHRVNLDFSSSDAGETVASLLEKSEPLIKDRSK